MENTFNFSNLLEQEVITPLQDWDIIEVAVKIKAVAHKTKIVTDWDENGKPLEEIDEFVLEFLDTHKVYEGERYIKLGKTVDDDIRKYFKTMRLFTKDGRRMGNVEVVSHEGIYNVIRTDKGNGIKLTDDEVEEIFYTTKAL